MAHDVDALSRSRVHLHVSTATPCHGLGIDTANSCQAHLLSVPCHARACACACARAPQCLEPFHTHACQHLDPACPCVHSCLRPGHSRAPTDVPNCSRTLPHVLSVTSHHGPGIDASAGKARCVLRDLPCACVLVCLHVIVATLCRDTDTCVPHARVHACTYARARACPRVCARTPLCCMACPLDVAHTPSVPVAAAPYHDAHDFSPRTRVP
ncbi:hypothetical protein SLEP1_g1173 [Rubroshorea leprosula]|uniref:Uncharacterized protein n=1 Tax=Rubroshorea leprosula TaxID=152421 RepID=A0AAV5HHN4_9ROSI|nr:hypothetical protein SLEP1_g1173 [Rubroshorea leprosula]